MDAIANQIPQIMDLMVEAHGKSPQQDIPYDLDVLEQHLNYWVHDPRSIVLVSPDVTACYIMTLAPSWWSRKPFVLDIFLYSKTPGSGFRLMKEAMQWVDAWGDSVAGEAITTSNASPDVDSMYKRLGYQTIGYKYQRSKTT